MVFINSTASVKLHCQQLIIDSYLLQNKEINLQIYLGGQNSRLSSHQVLTLDFGHQIVNCGSNLEPRKYYRRLLPSKSARAWTAALKYKKPRMLKLNNNQEAIASRFLSAPESNFLHQFITSACWNLSPLSPVCPSKAQQKSTVLLTLHNRNDVYFVLYSDVLMD